MYKNIEYADERENMKKVYGCDTMCTAKFLTSTLYLQSGHTHSCYHPLPHKIPLEEIKDNPSALHNTKHKRQRRKQMLNGERPEECNYCWRVEDIDESQLSDRVIKSKNELLLTPDAHEQILENGWDHNYRPTYLEISFGNECNMKCAYCHPKASSAWMKEMAVEGAFPDAPHLQVLEDKIYPEDDNPYVDAFWKWWPYLRKTLKVIRVTGGEPLLQQNVWKFLSKLQQTGECSEMVLQINTNLNVKNKLVGRMCDMVNQLLKEKKIKRFQIFSSVESWGERATYARNGLNLELFEQNVETIMNKMGHHHVDDFNGIQIMNTYNIMCVTSYINFLEKILEWRRKYQNGLQYPKIMFDIPHCTEPNHWTLIGLPDDYSEYVSLTTDFMERWKWKANWHKYPQEEHDQMYHMYFSEEELRAWNRVESMWKNICERRAKVQTDAYLEPREIDDARRNWYLFIKSTDERRGTNFKETFPEMSEYYDLCATLYDISEMEYNRKCKDELLKNEPMDFHWDDDFVWHHPGLAKALINWRKIRNIPTQMFSNDELVGAFGNFEGTDDEEQ
jgi:organic radical activating enzyme